MIVPPLSYEYLQELANECFLCDTCPYRYGNFDAEQDQQATIANSRDPVTGIIIKKRLDLATNEVQEPICVHPIKSDKLLGELASRHSIHISEQDLPDGIIDPHVKGGW